MPIARSSSSAPATTCSRSLPARRTIRVRPRGRYELAAVDGGTRVRFALEADVKGLKRVMAPMVQKTMNNEVGQLDQLKRAMEER